MRLAETANLLVLELRAGLIWMSERLSDAAISLSAVGALPRLKARLFAQASTFPVRFVGCAASHASSLAMARSILSGLVSVKRCWPASNVALFPCDGAVSGAGVRSCAMSASRHFR